MLIDNGGCNERSFPWPESGVVCDDVNALSLLMREQIVGNFSSFLLITQSDHESMLYSLTHRAFPRERAELAREESDAHVTRSAYFICV